MIQKYLRDDLVEFLLEVRYSQPGPRLLTQGRQAGTSWGLAISLQSPEALTPRLGVCSCLCPPWAKPWEGSALGMWPLGRRGLLQITASGRTFHTCIAGLGPGPHHLLQGSALVPGTQTLCNSTPGSCGHHQPAVPRG